MTTQPAPPVGPGSAAAPGSAGPGGHHDWHSREYVGEWIRDYEGRLESRRPQLDLLAALIPHAPDAPIRILDLGGGWGPVTRHVLERFPAASAVLLDYSEAMLEEASRRLVHLAGRVRLVQGHLSAPGALTRTLADHLIWLREAGFDAVDCFWRQERHAIVGGFVAPTA